MKYTFIKWLGTTIEDDKGRVDEKRVGFFMCLFILYKAMENPTANEIVVYTAALLAFGLVGLTVPEVLNRNKSTTKIIESSESSTIKTQD